MDTGSGPGLQYLLCLAWVAATLPIAAAALPIPRAAGGRFIHGLLCAFSSRGKTVRPSSSSSSKASLCLAPYVHTDFLLVMNCSSKLEGLNEFSLRNSLNSSLNVQRFTVPQKFFFHFYVVGVVVTTSLLLAIWFYAYMKMTPLIPEPSSYYSTIASHLVGGSNSFSLTNFWLSRPMKHKYHVWRTVFVLILMEIQVLRRLYETEHVFHYSPSARMHIIGYLTGIFYYVAAPLSLASSCLPETIQYLRYQIAEFIVKGRAKMPDLAIVPSHLLKPLLKLGWCQWIGAIIFIWGSLHQIHCHAILVCIRFCHSTSYLFVANANNIQQQLGSLREHKDSDEYVIPCGDWFSRVSCPHYLAELVIYFGMLIASGGSDISVWFLYLFVITNLSFAAVQTHKWYLRKFEDYPRSRYAIIPFVC
ncbi:Polyprenol reductase 1 [Zea mays]|uniref:Polyprenol reductase 1 n=1 Tax=Zea mays TaxID=4577 RepID=A0A3L6FU89_MAIZE|nr:Polyprenol reductase 1 [Zea mays]